MASELDPFSIVFNALWDMVDTHAPLSGYTNQAGAFIPGLIKPGNKIKFNIPEQRDPLKETVQAGDLPELVLSTGGITEANMRANTCSSMVQRTYQWLLSTGDFRTNYLLFPVQFALFAALHDWQGKLTTLTWRDKQFVKNARWGVLHEGQSVKSLNRNIEGWSSIWTCSVDMYFQINDIESYNIGS